MRLWKTAREDREGVATAGGRALFRVGQVSDLGRERTNNEDSLLVLRLVRHHGDATNDIYLMAVADGMGGAEHGEVASRLALTELTTYFSEHGGDAPGGDVSAHSDLLRDALASANERVIKAQDRRSGDNMGTTLVVAYAVGTALFLGHAGDSRCYLFQEGKILRATKDDSLVQQMVDAGSITEAEAASHPRRNQVTNGIGLFPSSRFKVTVRHVGDVREYEHILLCSDGLHGVVTDDEIARIVRDSTDMAEGARALVDAANARGGPDNISVILARVLGSAVQEERAPPPPPEPPPAEDA